MSYTQIERLKRDISEALYYQKRLTKKGGPHYACPDKVPIQRIRTLISAGYCKVPFTTGILIGIGETLEERIEALLLMTFPTE